MLAPHLAKSALAGYLAVFAGAVFIGIMPNAAKLAYAEGANPLMVLVARAVLGVILLASWLSLRGQALAIPRNWVVYSMLAGVTFGLTALGGMTAIAYIDVSLATLFFFLYPVPVAIIQHLTGAAPLTRRVLALILLALVGLALALGVSFADLHPKGVALAVLAVASLTTMILTVSDASAALGPVRANLHMSLWAGIYFLLGAAILPALGLIGPMQLPVTGVGWMLVLAAGVSFTLGYLFFFTATTILGATRASALSIVEAIMMILLAVIWVGESLGPMQWVGISIALLALWAMEAWAD